YCIPGTLNLLSPYTIAYPFNNELKSKKTNNHFDYLYIKFFITIMVIFGPLFVFKSISHSIYEAEFF
ncbi:hypothetical protein BpHYR1_043916, partial [Brachionus plicatilis]